jgi:hypothetical protein
VLDGCDCARGALTSRLPAQAPNGAAYWRQLDDGLVQWELADTDGNGAADVAVYRCGDVIRGWKSTPTTTGGRSDLSVQTGRQHTGYLDADGDGLLESPAGSPAEQRKILHEIGRGGERFNRLLMLRYEADGQSAPAVGPAPELSALFPIGGRPCLRSA